MEKPSGMPVLPVVPHWIDKPGKSELEAKKQTTLNSLPTIPDTRRQPRFKIEVDITINSRTCGMLKEHTLGISESGLAAMLPIEAPLGENVELNFTLPSGPVTIHAIVRQRRAFRYGFEFR